MMVTESDEEYTIFWDLDDCLYKNDWKVAIYTARIEEFTVGKLGLQPGYACGCIKNTARA